MRGRKPKPTALKLLEGTRADRVNQDEPVLPPATIELPEEFEGDRQGTRYAREQWERLAPMLLACGVLTVGDRPALALLCLAYASTRVDPDDVKARESYRRMLVEFGLTPSSRSRLRVSTDKPRDQLAVFMARRK